ncbi:uncharacterized protein LOC121649813 isoform X2 [Melanotaenia boesemani]|nr:uncharacterized protein LOC121649813 isoform X2 [Melanotaenia boesemani]
MALKGILSQKIPGPFFKPPPLFIHVLCSKEDKRVISWDFIDGSATPCCTKINKCIAVTDGQFVTKVTLFEELAHKVVDNRNYYLKGYELRGTSPPYTLWVTRETKFYRTSPVHVTPDLFAEGEKLLNPESRAIPLGITGEVQGFLTIEGRVVLMSEVKKISIRRGDVPMRRVQIEEKDTQVTVTLWREATMEKIELGKRIKITHLKLSSRPYRDQLQSTRYSTLEVCPVPSVLPAGRS